jgi:Delta24-sterol reductase
MERHNKAVAAIAADVRRFYDRKESFRIFHGSTNSTRSSPFRRNRMIDTSGLCHVLKVDREKRTALVEPNVPMDRLVDTTMKYGLVPPVVMEFPGITVGGGYAGTSGESSSFKHGFFDRTINYVRMVLANGDIVTASRTERADLFNGAAGAVGTLGITTLVELQLIQAKKYVETTYHPVSSVSEATQTLQKLTADPNLDYIDGILFSLNQGVIITGRMTDASDPNLPIRRFSRAQDPWFYLHAQDTISNSPATPTTELIPLDEYLFRYDRGGFWVGRSAFHYFYTPFNWLTRWLLDDFLHTRVMYTALHASGFSTQYVVQDLALPYSTVEEFVRYTDRKFGIYPLWLCPLRQEVLPTVHPHSSETEADGKTLKPMLNVGLWGYGHPDRNVFLKLNRDLEAKLRDLGGMKWLYANTYYTASEFWSIYDRIWYGALRAKYDATSLPSVYDKVRTDIDVQEKAVQKSWGYWLLGKWPASGLWGLWKAATSGQQLLAKKERWKSIEEKDRAD